jgi:hypothetical protein
MEVFDSKSDQIMLYLPHQILTRRNPLEQIPYPLSIFQLSKTLHPYLRLLLLIHLLMSNSRKLQFTVRINGLSGSYKSHTRNLDLDEAILASLFDTLVLRQDAMASETELVAEYLIVELSRHSLWSCI